MHIGTHSNIQAAVKAKMAQEAHQASEGKHASSKKKAKKEEAAAPQESVTISYLPQDPASPLPVQQGVVEGKVEPGLANERFRVSVPSTFPQATPGKDGNYSFEVSDPNFDSANSFFVSQQTLKMAEEYAGRDLPWAFSKELGRDQLIIHPHAGSGTVNAFYISEAGSTNYFNYQNDDREVHRTGVMSDVVAHETGHAILDAIRPTYIRTLAVPAGGFHESFGDMMSMLRALHEPAVIEQLKDETKGDLGKSNVVSKLAEQLGQDAYETPALRDGVNNHKYADQHFLPYVEPELKGNGFGTEPHAYATLFTGAFYDLIKEIYNVAAADPNVSFTEAISVARDVAGSLLLRAVEFAPIGNPAYPEMAQAFLQADQIDNGGGFRPVIEEVFRARGILSDSDVESFDAKTQAMPKVSLVSSALEKKGAEKFLAKERKALGLPNGVDFAFEKAYTSKKGETFLMFSTKREGVLDSPDFGTNEGSKYEGVGGLLLGFDKDKKLFLKNYDEVTDREMSDIKTNVRALSIAGNLVQGTGSPQDADANDKIHVQVVNDGSGPILRKAGVLYC
jgi:hypothetical protein